MADLKRMRAISKIQDNFKILGLEISKDDIEAILDEGPSGNGDIETGILEAEYKRGKLDGAKELSALNKEAKEDLESLKKACKEAEDHLNKLKESDKPMADIKEPSNKKVAPKKGYKPKNPY
jgi:hypothetical protein